MLAVFWCSARAAFIFVGKMRKVSFFELDNTLFLCKIVTRKARYHLIAPDGKLHACSLQVKCYPEF